MNLVTIYNFLNHVPEIYITWKIRDHCILELLISKLCGMFIQISESLFRARHVISSPAYNFISVFMEHSIGRYFLCTDSCFMLLLYCVSCLLFDIPLGSSLPSFLMAHFMNISVCFQINKQAASWAIFCVPWLEEHPTDSAADFCCFSP